MALNKDTLTALIQANVANATGYPMTPEALLVWSAVADAIVTHITSAAVVTTAVITASPANLTGTTIPGGAPISGPGIGRIS